MKKLVSILLVCGMISTMVANSCWAADAQSSYSESFGVSTEKNKAKNLVNNNHGNNKKIAKPTALSQKEISATNAYFKKLAEKSEKTKSVLKSKFDEFKEKLSGINLDSLKELIKKYGLKVAVAVCAVIAAVGGGVALKKLNGANSVTNEKAFDNGNASFSENKPILDGTINQNYVYSLEKSDFNPQVNLGLETNQNEYEEFSNDIANGIIGSSTVENEKLETDDVKLNIEISKLGNKKSLTDGTNVNASLDDFENKVNTFFSDGSSTNDIGVVSENVEEIIASSSDTLLEIEDISMEPETDIVNSTDLEKQLDPNSKSYQVEEENLGNGENITIKEVLGHLKDGRPIYRDTPAKEVLEELVSWVRNKEGTAENNFWTYIVLNKVSTARALVNLLNPKFRSLLKTIKDVGVFGAIMGAVLGLVTGDALFGFKVAATWIFIPLALSPMASTAFFAVLSAALALFGLVATGVIKIPRFKKMQYAEIN